MSFWPQHTSFDIFKYWKWVAGCQGLALKNSAQCSLILKRSGVHYIRGKKTYFTLKMNTHISDEKSQSLHSSREREESLLSLVSCKRMIILSRSYTELDSSLSDFSPKLLPCLLLYRQFLLLWLALGVLFNKIVLKANSFIALWIETSTPIAFCMQAIQFSINCFIILPSSS